MRKQIAKETVKYTQQGFYCIDDKKIDFELQQRNSENNSILIKPSDTINLPACPNYETNYKIVGEQTVETLFKLNNLDNIGILNFASAKNPGGGFLNGAKAQEESLAISSGLYLTLIKNEEYYQQNRICGNMIYTDYMIYSPDVIFIRDKTLNLVKNPVKASVLTAPAVNIGQILLKTPELKLDAQIAMKNRMSRILDIFAAKGNTTLILGAYGCGVFKNDPVIVAKYWKELLQAKDKQKYFKNIIFSIYDTSSNQNILNIFKNTIKNDREI